MIRYFLLISIALTLTTGCAVNKNSTRGLSYPESFLKSTSKAMVFRSTFDYKDYHFSGLIVVKPVADTIVVNFMSEIGPTIMAFHILRNRMVVTKTIEVLNKRILLKHLERDLRLLLMANLYFLAKVRHLGMDKEYALFRASGKKKHLIFSESTSLHRVEQASYRGVLFDKVEAKYEYLRQNSIPKSITLEHSMVDLKMKWNLLNR